jgi:cytochrome c551/c552
MSPYLFARRYAGACLFLAALGLPMVGQAGQAGPQLASNMGCYNCHGGYPRADAPSFDRLAAKFSGRKGDHDAEQKLVDKFRNGEWLEHVDAHERVSPDTARALMHWLIDGAK